MEELRVQIQKIIKDSSTKFWEESGGEIPPVTEKEEKLIDKLDIEMMDEIMSEIEKTK